MEDVIHCWEPQEVSIKESMSPPYPCLLRSPYAGRMWFHIEIYEHEYIGSIDEFKGSMCVEEELVLLSCFPYPCPKHLSLVENGHGPHQHAIEFERENIGWGDMFEVQHWDGKHYVGDWLEWGLKLGVAPFQPFELDIEVQYDSYYDSWSDGYEYDVFYNWDVMNIEEMDEEERCKKIEEARRILYVPVEEDTPASLASPNV